MAVRYAVLGRISEKSVLDFVDVLSGLDGLRKIMKMVSWLRLEPGIS
jgi:hypothetical protein